MALTTSLISFYELDEASGTRNDAHTSGNHLSDSGSSTRLGGVNGAFSVDLTAGGNLFRATNASLETGNIDFTIAGWVTFNAWTAYYYVVSKYPSTANQREYALFYDFGAHQLQFTTRNGDDTGDVYAVSTVTIPNLNTSWHFVVMGQDTAAPQKIFISVDNETLVTTNNPTGMHVGNGPFMLGGLGWSASQFSGWIDQVGFWKRLLTGSERTWLYNAGAGRSYAEIVAAAGETRAIAMVIGA